MNIFDVNKYGSNQDFSYTPVNNSQKNTKQSENELPIEQFVNDYFKSNSNKSFTGSMINNSDTELLNNHLENYLASDSLRLELQIDRLSTSLEKTQRELNALVLLPDSEVKLNQQKILLTKRQQIVNSLNQYKEEYRNLGPIHNFALWLKDKFKTSRKFGDNFKRLLFQDKAKFLDEIKNAQTSMELLIDQAENINNTPSTKESNLTMIDILKQYDKINSNISQSTDQYYGNQPVSVLDKLKKQFQILYYGYEIPKKYN